MSGLFENITNPFNTPFVSNIVGFDFNELHNKNPFDTSFSTAWFVMAVLFVMTILSLVAISFIFSFTDCVGSCCCPTPKRSRQVSDDNMELRGKKV